MQTVRCDFSRGHAPHLLHQSGIPAARGGKLAWKNSSLFVQAMPVDGVDSEQHRNAEPCGKRDGLHFSGVVSQHVQKRPRALSRPVQRFLPRYHAVGNLHHLRGFLFQRHA
ncbi:hypothetical protein SDC9_116752 [bioreactor metagenome]|uniref:Uncharacterized protein n=1 Tax=bioreactor metagenome TaxID=1076179 RepID=A0A645C773_9ZZZZ